MKKVMVTGGAGFIGSHTLVELRASGYEPVVVDNLLNSAREALRRVERISGGPVAFYEGDVRDAALLERIFGEHEIAAAIHFAGLKAVGESVAKPLEYYQNNLDSTLALCSAMRRAGVKTLVFSSSATVYGTPERVPLTEDMPTSCTNPYGWTKWMNEQILRDLRRADPEWSVILLRYFNPIGAHPSGLIGEDPRGVPNNLMPYINQVAVGRLEKLHVFGADYPTPDGTGVRDYIHVVDLAKGHCKALDYALSHRALEAVNLGTGRGVSVLELIRTFEAVTGARVPYQIDARRPGDIACCYADVSKARALLGWTAELGLDAMCADGWRFQKNNPHGY